MSELITRTAKLQPRVKRTKALPSFATTYVFEADEHPELGGMYVVLEALVNPKQGQALADLIIETLGEQYYNNEDVANNDLLPRFEKAIKATNKALAEFTDKGNAAWVGRLSAVAAIVCKGEVHVTQTGSAEAHLYRANRVSHITEGLAASGPHRPGATFGSIASGQLHEHDRIVISTPALFHQISGPDLKNLVEDSSANGAVTKISELIGEREDADRVAALVIEVATAEYLAANALPDEPEEVSIGQGDKPMDLAKAAAGPALNTIVSKGKELSEKVTHHTTNTVLPVARKSGLAAASWLRTQLSKPSGRRNAAIILGVLVIGVIFFNVRASQSHSFDTQLAKYDAAYKLYEKALTDETTDKQTARTELVQVQNDLNALAKTSGRGQLDSKISHRSHPENDPASIDKLLKLVNAEIDKVDGLFTVSPTELAKLGTKPVSVENIGSKILVVGNDGSVMMFDQSSSKLSTLVDASTGLGTPVASAVSSNNDGIYILTKKPSVWLVKLDGNTAEQQLSTGDWEAGRAISSYSGNLYILSDNGNQVYKHVPTAGGFSARSAYFSGTALGQIVDSTSLAVNGYVYTSGSYGLRRFGSGKFDAELALPDHLKQPLMLHSVNDGNVISFSDGESHRVGIVSATDSALSYGKQLQLSGNLAIISSVPDTKGSVIFVITKDKLYKVVTP